MKTGPRWAVGVCLLLASSFSAGADAGMAILASETNRALLEGDPARLQVVREAVHRWRDQTPADPLTAYWLAVIDFHLAMAEKPGIPENMRPQPPEETLQQAVESAQTALRLDPSNPETHAMLCVLLGVRISENRWRALWLGPRFMRHGERALSSPPNPRALYLTGTCRYHTAKTPKDWDRVREDLERADALFREEAKQPSDPLEPRWGHPDCLLFLGRTLERLDDPHDAAEVYQRVLEMRPDSSLARDRWLLLEKTRETD